MRKGQQRPIAAQLSDRLTCWPAGVPSASTQPGPDGDDDEQGPQLAAEEEQSLADLMSSLTSKPVQLAKEEEDQLADLMSSLTGKPVQLGHSCIQQCPTVCNSKGLATPWQVTNCSAVREAALAGSKLDIIFWHGKADRTGQLPTATPLLSLPGHTARGLWQLRPLWLRTLNQSVIAHLQNPE